MKGTNSKLGILALAALAVVLGLAVAPTTAGDAEKDDAKASLPDGQVRTVIPVSGMTCGGCAAIIKTVVKKLDGIVEVEVDHEKGNTSVTYVKEKVTVTEIVNAINKMGYKATEPKEGKDS